VIEGTDKVVPFGTGVFGLLYTNCREFMQKMTNEEKYEANIRSDFRVRPPRLVREYDSVQVVRLT